MQATLDFFPVALAICLISINFGSLSPDASLLRVLTLIPVSFILFFGLYFVVQAFVPVLASLLPKSVDIAGLFSSLPDSVWFFVNMFMVTEGIKLMFSALLTRFIIRRIPLIG
ncbi:TPA: DUF2523 domain-containing protein [Yersinia enterocolitica]|uniref:DUF2523 domain-containing protein n=2 Tax=Yersinia enterocolitica TaxID=630 RepID=A0A7T9XTJ2_YEREN|nr:DUF2523 family protein [Yersinia enterocolitica]EHB19331.1 putative phage-related membrane protein [Yersinia enterocolitica subsp. palearctica PhRBD_Ye1]EKN3314887.1 DUF2523 domain-containing protein [Yersinia enterocolitica]EKN3318789.1 DUF2523 domain-containing protein [Yersinia enterocolitica]EKN3322739.1 DUF2523 domain-containing protein [Yersinia enterocolitica]EKN3335581.1 DUF2523 domain-containing protein [Yersinia enterocolitica]